MQLLEGVPIGDIGLGGLVVMFVLAILRGWLIPQAMFDRMLADRDQWREAAQTNSATIAEQSKQITELMEAGRTAVHLAESLHNVVLPPDREER